MTIEQKIEFEIEEYVGIHYGKESSTVYEGPRNYTIKIKGSTEQKQRVGEALPFRQTEEDSTPYLPTHGPNEETHSLIHLMQVAMWLAQRAHPNEKLEDLVPKFEFKVLRHESIKLERDVDVTKERSERYKGIVGKIISGDYSRFYESLDKALAKR